MKQKDYFLENIQWTTWNLDNYSRYGFGLWAVALKKTNEFIGDCGITIQKIDGELLPEIGMKKVKEYPDPKNEISYAYSLTKEEW